MALLAGALGITAEARAQSLALAGDDRVRVALPNGSAVQPYGNAGYRLRVEGGVATVEVGLVPLRSRQPFALPAGEPQGALAVLARAVAGGATTRYQAVTQVLQWVARHVTYDLDRQAPQDAASVLARRSAYCTGTARLTVALLQELGIPAREVPGFLVVDSEGAARAGYHRWIEAHYDDVGWVFSDPLASFHYVPATYLRLASEELPADAAPPARLLGRDDRRLPVDLLAESPASVTVRRNDGARRAAALQVSVGRAGEGRAVLDGGGTRRVRPLRRGASTFVGLEPGSYLLRVEVEGAPPSLKRVILRDRVWGSVHLPLPPPSAPVKEEST